MLAGSRRPNRFLFGSKWRLASSRIARGSALVNKGYTPTGQSDCFGGKDVRTLLDEIVGMTNAANRRRTRQE
jgi:hypothetical protein